MRNFRSLIRFIMPKLHNSFYYFYYLIRNNKISFYCVISKGTLINNCKIEAYSYIGQYCILNAVQIGKYTSIAPYVIIGGAEHSYWWYSTSHFISKHNKVGNVTSIGNDVWIGAHAIIRQGVKIGNGAVIGAGSVILNDVEPYSIVVGIPAKKIRMRFQEEVINKIEKSKYWDFSPLIAKKILSDLNSLNKEEQ